MNELAKSRGAGTNYGLLACVMAVMGTITIGMLFVPLAIIAALIGTIKSVKTNNKVGIGVNVLAWIFTIIAVATSPSILMLLGVTAQS